MRAVAFLAFVLLVVGVGAAAAKPSPSVEYVLGASGKTAPPRLSRDRPTGIALKAGFTSGAPGSTATPELGRIALELNRAVEFHTAGLPSCPLAKVGSPADPRQSCARSIVGHGTVDSEIALPRQAPVRVEGSLLAFYTLAEGEPHILARVTTGEPLPLIYVIPFEIVQGDSPFGTKLVVQQMHRLQGVCRANASDCFAQPYKLAGVYSRISSLEISLHRAFGHAQHHASFVTARCPHVSAPIENFPLLRVTAHYAGQPSRKITRSTVISGRC